MPVFPAPLDDPGAPGALIEGDYQYEFRGLLFGSGTSFLTEKVDGLLSTPDARDQSQDKSNDHGVHSGVLLYGKKIITFDMKILGRPGADIEEKMELASRAFQVPRIRNSRKLQAFVFKRPGSVPKLCWVRCTKREFPSNYETARGLVKASVQLVAPDPRIYALNSLSQDLTLLPGEATGQMPVSQIGNFEDGAPPTIEISGPATNPIIQNETDDGRAVRLNIVLGAEDAVRVDVGSRKVEVRRGVAGDWVRDYTIVRPDNQWWNLIPGVNIVRYNRTGTAAASTMTLTWQDVWI